MFKQLLISLVTVVWLNFEATVLYRLPYPNPDEKRSSKCSFTWCDFSRSCSGRQKVPERVWDSTERLRDEHRMKLPWDSRTFLVCLWCTTVAIGLAVKGSFGSVPFHFSTFWQSSLKVRTFRLETGWIQRLGEAAGKTSRQEMLLQAVNQPRSLPLIDSTGPWQIVCIQFCNFGNQINTRAYNLFKCCRHTLTSNPPDMPVWFSHFKLVLCCQTLFKPAELHFKF